MILSGYLVITPKKVGPNYYQRNTAEMRVTKQKPTLKAKEIAFSLEITLPDTLWDRPITEVKLDVPRDILVNPEAETAVQMIAPQVADALRVEVKDIEDGLRAAITKRNEEQNNDNQS